MNTDTPPEPSPATPPPIQKPVSRPVTPTAKNGNAALDFQPMENPATFFSVIETLLKQPGRVLYECKEGNAKVPVLLLISAVLCLAVFGGLLGTFSGGVQAWAAPLKIVTGLLISLIICLPSLYIFSALGGLNARLSQVAGLLLAAISLTSLLLLGFAPVVWIFSQSTESVCFMGFLALIFWIIGLYFGFRLLFVASTHLCMDSSQYLRVWMGIFVLVTLQMSTALRPLIGTAPTTLPTQKKFFLEHWFDEFGEGSNARRADK